MCVILLFSLLPYSQQSSDKQAGEFGVCIKACVSHHSLPQFIEMMETLLDEYGNQDKQLNRMHATLVVLEYGYNSLRQQLSGAECSVSQVLELSRSIADGLTQGVESKLEEVTSCIDGAESTLESVKSTTHPCGEGDWELVVDEDYSEDGGDSAFFDVNREYTKVCGKIVGYGVGLNAAFSAGFDIDDPLLMV